METTLLLQKKKSIALIRRANADKILYVCMLYVNIYF